MFRELFCRHDYEGMSFYKAYWDKSKSDGLWHWVVVYRCKKCAKHKEEQVIRGNEDDILKFLAKEQPNG